MPSRQWFHAWSSIRRSDDEGMKALRELVATQEYDAFGQGEMIVGKMTGICKYTVNLHCLYINIVDI